MATFIGRHLDKTHNSFLRNPNFSKFYVSHCSGRITKNTPTTESWLKIVKLLKLDITDYDKSRILLGSLEKYGEVVVKIGNTTDIENEYKISKELSKLKGFVKYICFFECNDNFRRIVSETHLCDGPGSSMKVVIMPYFRLGSLASYKWDSNNIKQLHSCLKNAFLTIVFAFQIYGFLHGDFHAGNVLLKETKQVTVLHSDAVLGTFEILTYGIRTWIMDYEKSKFILPKSSYEEIMALNDYYYDLVKFFMFLKETIPIYLTSIQPIQMYLGKLNMSGKKLSKDNIEHILDLIDTIQLTV